MLSHYLLPWTDMHVQSYYVTLTLVKVCCDLQFMQAATSQLPEEGPTDVDDAL